MLYKHQIKYIIAPLVGDNIAEGTSLNTYIRDVANLKGTKYMCTEGGCGACLVSATVEHPVSRVKETFSINSVSILSKIKT